MSLRAFVDRVVAHVRSAPVDLARLPPEGVPGSIFSGAAGVALFLHETARLRGQDELLPVARQWLDAAEGWAARAGREGWRGLPRGLLVGEAGLAYVDALLALREGDAGRVRGAAERIERVTERFDDVGPTFGPNDLVGGTASAVCLACALDARLPGALEHDATRAALARVRDRGLAMLEASCAAPLGDRATLGLAHGVAGELWPLVHVRGTEHPVVQQRLGEIRALREVDDAGLTFWLPRRGQWELEKVSSWCNGTAGHSLLWTDVARASGTEDARETARLAAESTAALGAMEPSVCCGLAGESLALQRYADLSGDPRFTRRAYERLARAAQWSEPLGQDALGLWVGALGVALAAMMRLEGEKAFPVLDPAAAAERL